MANVIRIKRSTGSTAPSSLAEGEMAYTFGNDNLYIGAPSSTIRELPGADDKTKLDNIEANADVTDATNVDAAGAVMETDYNAQTVLIAVADNTPSPVTISASTFVGRKATGDAGILTASEARAVLSYPASEVSNTPAGGVSATTVQAAIDELDGDKVDISGDTLTGFLTLHSDPSNPLHAATKQYVDATSAGLDPKAAVRVATTGNITLSGLQTVDGVSLAANDRVLVKDQSTAADNGIYDVVNGGAWTRSSDADTSAEVTTGMYTIATQGTANGKKGFILTTQGTINLGTTGLTFELFSDATSAPVDSVNGLTGAVVLTYSTLTAQGTIATADLGNDQVTYDKIQNVVSDNVFLGNDNGANQGIQELTKTEALAILNVADGAEVNPALVSQAVAEAGTDSNEYIWSSLRVRQNVENATIDGGTF